MRKMHFILIFLLLISACMPGAKAAVPEQEPVYVYSFRIYLHPTFTESIRLSGKSHDFGVFTQRRMKKAVKKFKKSFSAKISEPHVILPIDAKVEDVYRTHANSTYFRFQAEVGMNVTILSPHSELTISGGKHSGMPLCAWMLGAANSALAIQN